MNEIASMLNAVMELGYKDRSNYQLTLGDLISKLAYADDDAVVRYSDGRSPGNEMSYRGYYSDLSFQDADDEVIVKELLSRCESALGSTYEGYKGGDNVMGPETPLWRSSYGEASGLAIMDAVSVDNAVILTTKRID